MRIFSLSTWCTADETGYSQELICNTNCPPETPLCPLHGISVIPEGRKIGDQNYQQGHTPWKKTHTHSSVVSLSMLPPVFEVGFLRGVLHDAPKHAQGKAEVKRDYKCVKGEASA